MSKAPGIPHNHRQIVPGCFRCDLSADEEDRAATTDPSDKKAIDAAFRDLLIYGSMHVILRADGQLERTPPEEWTRRIKAPYRELPVEDTW